MVQAINEDNFIICLPAQPVLPCVLKFSLLNMRSVCHKTSAILDLVHEYQLDLFAITETWLCANGDEVLINELTPPNFNFIHMPRGSRGGGVGFLSKKTLCFNAISSVTHHSFESLEAYSVTANLRVVVVYRPPPSTSNRFTVSQFLEEFTEYTQYLNTATGNLLIVGDFNFHMDNSESLDVKKISSLLYSENLYQHVMAPTHQHGHILDLVISRASEQVIDNICVCDPHVSDHMLITGIANYGKPTAEENQSICVRRTREIDLVKFKSDIYTSTSCNIDGLSTLTDFVTAYGSVEDILDKHAPIIRKLVKPNKKNEAWFGKDIIQAKKVRRQYERQWLKTGLSVHKDLFKNQCKVVWEKIHVSRRNYYSKKITDATFQNS